MVTSLEKQLLKNIFLNTGLSILVLSFLLMIILRLDEDPSIINYIFITFDGFIFGYFGIKAYKSYKKYVEYKKFGVRGTWGN